jgi:hypothetical protein
MMRKYMNSGVNDTVLVNGKPRNAARMCRELEAENARLVKGLTYLAEGSTPWVYGYSSEAWEVMAKYAKHVLENDVETVTDRDYHPLPSEGRAEKREEDARLLAADIRRKL